MSNSTTPQPKTYQDLLDLLQQRTPEELQQPVRSIGEEKAGEIIDFWILEEDYVNCDGEAMEPVSCYADDPDFDLSQQPFVAKKGTLFLLE